LVSKNAKIIKFTDDIAFSSQPTVDQLQNLSLIGIKSVINMRYTDEVGFIIYEAKIVRDSGFEYYQIPVRFAHILMNHM